MPRQPPRRALAVAASFLARRFPLSSRTIIQFVEAVFSYYAKSEAEVIASVFSIRGAEAAFAGSGGGGDDDDGCAGS